MSRRKRSETVQDFVPVRDIRHGVIETSDHRYIKILEIEPVGFMLLSEEERMEIIVSFASWLKIAPIMLQFKSITQKADSERYIAGLLRELAGESNASCRMLGEEYIGLVRELGRHEALTRRFFLVLQYEALRRSDSEDFDRVLSALETAAQNATAYLAGCGNTVLHPKDPDEATAEILYLFYNRRSAVDEPFHTRVERVVIDTMTAEGLTVGKDDIPPIPIANFLCPRGIDLSHSSYTVMDGRYYTVLYIQGSGYPGTVKAGWMTALVNAGEGIDIDIFLHREDRGHTIDKVARRIRLNRTKLRGVQDTSTDYEELTGSVEAGYYIKSGIAERNEDLFYLSTFITVSADRYEELLWRKRQLTDLLKSMDMQISECRYSQEDALLSIMPLVRITPSLERKAQRNVLTSGAASAYMFTSFEMSDEDGILLGVNRYNSSLCMLDLFDTKKHKNANLNLIGTSGAGKTFTLQLLAMRMRMRGIRCFILAPIKGHEFRRACHQIGGSFISIAPGSPHCINIMEIRHTLTPETALIDGADSGDESMLARKIQQILLFFSLLIPDLSSEEEQLLDAALTATYADFGITQNNDTLYEDKYATPPVMKVMPVLGDLYARLCGNSQTARLAAAVCRFVSGSAQSFNRQTNVDLSNPYTVLDLSELKGKLLPAGMMLALDFIWDKIKADRTERKAVFIDEIWQLIGASSNRMAAEFCLTIFKTIRGWGGAAISATQDLSDFFGLDDGKYGRAIINNSKNKIILNLEPDEARYVKDILKLTPTEVHAVCRFERGEALVCSGSSRVPVTVRASQAEREMITTDRRELEALYRKEERGHNDKFITQSEMSSGQVKHT